MKTPKPNFEPLLEALAPMSTENTQDKPATEGCALLGSVSDFRTVVADPPWPYGIRGPASSKEHRPNSHGAATSSVERYGAMSIKDLCALPVEELAAENSHLYLWTTNSFMVEAHEIARAWGYEPKTILTWAKMKADGTPSMKTGFYFRGSTEHCLFAVRGSQRLNGRIVKPTLYESERLPHSVKPEWFYRLVEECSPGPYLELFARRKRSGWAAWGNEVDSDICMPNVSSADTARK